MSKLAYSLRKLAKSEALVNMTEAKELLVQAANYIEDVDLQEKKSFSVQRMSYKADKKSCGRLLGALGDNL